MADFTFSEIIYFQLVFVCVKSISKIGDCKCNCVVYLCVGMVTTGQMRSPIISSAQASASQNKVVNINAESFTAGS